MTSPAPQVVTFGELMLRLTTQGHERLVRAGTFDARYTGAEANVAVSLATFGLRASVVSRVPDNEIGQACVNYLRQFGVDTSSVVRGGKRLGLLYVEPGYSLRPSAVVYDRDGSSFHEACPDEFEWPRILSSAAWLHFSGTAPSRGTAIISTLRQACEAARAAGATVSCDVNYRSALWTRSEAGEVMRSLMDGVDVCFASLDDVAMLAPGADPRPEPAAQALRERFALQATVVTYRSGSSASSGNLAAALSTGNDTCSSRGFSVESVDRIGGGDALCAGFIYATLDGRAERNALNFAVAAACLKQTIPGDFNLATVAEVDRLLGGEDGARVRR